MWCPHCQADTTPANADSYAELRCGQCGNPVSSRPASADSVRQARDILARWSSSSLLDEITALPEIPPIPGNAAAAAAGPAREVVAEATPEPDSSTQSEHIATVASDPVHEIAPDTASSVEPQLNPLESKAASEGDESVVSDGVPESFAASLRAAISNINSEPAQVVDDDSSGESSLPSKAAIEESIEE
ncbi:MAG TPA: hypothetical protein DCG12_06790, partial [Planctomycetaceae bacterium]|nr:hypothetical protein [Planctomycetaceae bacterium]